MHSDSELYALFLTGDTSAYDELMIRYGDSLTIYINGYLHNLHDAEDLMIEAFARVMVKRPRIREGGVKAYLYKTARNLTIRFHERETRIKSFSIDDSWESVSAGSVPENEIIDDERKRILRICMQRLDPELREVLWLIYFESMSYEQAADVMKVSRKRIDHLLQRGKRTLREELAKEGMTDVYE